MSARLPFNPGLNQLVLADLPGLPSGAAGSRVNQWLCSWAIGQRMAAVPAITAAAQALVGAELQLVPLPTVDRQPTVTADLIAAGGVWPRLLSSMVERGQPASVELADDLGRVLGGLAATLVLGPADARAARPDWPAAQWDSWSRVRRVTVGGGIVARALGTRMTSAATAWMADARVPVELDLAPEPASLVLRGTAAGGVPGGARVGVVLDCGATSIKRAVADDSGLDPRPGAPAPEAGLTAYDVLENLVRAAAEVAPPGDEPVGVAVALATYVDEHGQPYAGQLGPYACLADVDLVGELTRGLTERLGRSVAVRVRHDGASALLGARLDDETIDAAIVLGTAVGNAVDPVTQRDR